MNKNSTLIYHFNSLSDSKPILFDLQQFLRDDETLRIELKNLKNIRLKSPKIGIFENI